MFSKNRERLLNQEVARASFACVLVQANPHLSDEDFRLSMPRPPHMALLLTSRYAPTGHP